LNFFSGQLYLSDYEVYRNLCAFLGLYIHVEDRAGTVVDNDGFVRPGARFYTREIRTIYTGCPFVISPVPFPQELMALQRKHNKYL
ncbi:hypothetical protein J3R30DRAFT_3281685, partial [Lentinula aciculospora]